MRFNKKQLEALRALVDSEVAASKNWLIMGVETDADEASPLNPAKLVIKIAELREMRRELCMAIKTAID